MRPTLSPGNDRQPPKSWCSARRQTWDPARWICSPHQRHACSGESAQSPAGKLCAGMGKHLSLFHFSVCHTQTKWTSKEKKTKTKKGLPITSFYDLEFFCWMLLALPLSCSRFHHCHTHIRKDFRTRWLVSLATNKKNWVTKKTNTNEKRQEKEIQFWRAILKRVGEEAVMGY